MARRRTGHLNLLDGPSTWTRFAVSLRAQELQFFPAESGAGEPPAPAFSLDLAGAVVSSPEALRGGRRHCISLEVLGGPPVHLSADGREEHESWLSALAAAAVADAWPGGAGLAGQPAPLLYGMWAVQHAGTAAVFSGGGALASEARVPSPFARLPALKSVPAWQRKGLLLQKLRQCGIVFDGLPADKFLVDREVKRNTLLEVLDFFEAGGKAAVADLRVLEDTFAMIRLNLFRTLPVAPEPVGDPDEEEVPFADPQWPHLNIVYELLRRLVASEHLELPLKKRLLDAPFVKALLQLFNNDEPREREFLKLVTHSIYSKLNMRRALIRRAVCNVFFETVLADEAHRGVSELLEVLASIINGFAVPIKQEHKLMLTRALLPLHKSKTLASYHVPLTYCMQLFAVKEHALTRDIVPALLRFWPFAAAQKQVMFLNELEDVLEYVQEDDLHCFRDALVARLASCIGGLHFQLAERALALWNSERFCRLTIDFDAHRTPLLIALFPALVQVDAHWHEGIRAAAARVLALFEAADGATFAALRQAVEVEEGSGASGGGGGGGGAQPSVLALSPRLEQLALEPGGAGLQPPRSPPGEGVARRPGYVLPVSDVGEKLGGGGGGRRAAKPLTLLGGLGDE